MAERCQKGPNQLGSPGTWWQAGAKTLPDLNQQTNDRHATISGEKVYYGALTSASGGRATTIVIADIDMVTINTNTHEHVLEPYTDDREGTHLKALLLLTNVAHGLTFPTQLPETRLKATDHRLTTIVDYIDDHRHVSRLTESKTVELHVSYKLTGTKLHVRVHVRLRNVLVTLSYQRDI